MAMMSLMAVALLSAPALGAMNTTAPAKNVVIPAKANLVGLVADLLNGVSVRDQWASGQSSVTFQWDLTKGAYYESWVSQGSQYFWRVTYDTAQTTYVTQTCKKDNIITTSANTTMSSFLGKQGF